MHALRCGTCLVISLAMLTGCGDEKQSEEKTIPAAVKTNPSQESIPADTGEKITGQPTGKAQLDLSYISEDFSLAVVIHPRRLLASPLLGDGANDGALDGFVEEALKNTGFDARKVEQIIVVVGLRSPKDKADPSQADDVEQPMPPPAVVGIVLRYSEALDKKAFADKGLTERLARFPDERTIVFTNHPDEDLLNRMLEAKDVDSPLVRRLRATNADVDAVVVAVVEPWRPMIADALGGDSPGPFAVLASLPEQLETARLTLDLEAESALALELEAIDEESAEAIHAMATLLVGLMKVAVARNGEKILEGIGGLVEAKSVQAASDLVAGTSVDIDGRTVSVRLARPAQWQDLAKIVRGLGDEQLRVVRRTRRMSRMRNLGLAVLAFSELHDSIPLASMRSGPSKPPVSWRVQILHMLGHAELIEQYRVDEPWDSEHNKKLISQMPDVFGDSKDGKTRFVAPVGKGTIWGSDKPLSPADIERRDGLTGTILLVEVAPEKAVIWTKPEDMPYDSKNPLANFGKLDGEFLTLFADTRVEVTRTDVDLDALRAMFSYAGQEKPQKD